jgi:hypothetical protein
MDGKAMTAKYAELSGSARWAYADVLDNAMARELDTGVGFNFLKRENKSGAYWYLQHSFAGTKKQFYVGADTEEVRNAISVTESRWELDRVEAIGMQKLVAMAQAAGCAGLPARAYRVLFAAAQAGLFRSGGVLVGSHAFVAIGNMLSVSWVKNTAETQDRDLAIYDQALVAMPKDAKPLGETILDSETGLLSVPLLSPKHPSTSFKVQGEQFRVDLVTPMIGKPSEGPVFVSAVKSYAQPVRYLDFILEDTQKAVLLQKAGVLVNVPNPARYALHKLVVSQRRPAAEAAKSKKDVDQAAQIIAALLSQRPGDLWLALDAAAEYHAKFMTELQAGIEPLDDDLREVLVEQIES